MSKFASAFFLAYLAGSTPALAQGFDFTPPSNGLDIYLSSQNFNDAIDRTVENSGPADNGSAQPALPVRAVNLTFSPSKARTTANIRNFAAKSRNIDPNGAAQMERLLVPGDIIGQLGQTMRPMGLNPHNVADTYALWWYAAWHAVHKRQVQPDRAALAAVKRQAESAMSATPEMASANDAQKQEFAESLLLQTAMIDGSINEAAGNNDKQTALANAVNQGAKKMGLDLTTMTLTPNGFVPRNGGRSDASDPAADNTQLAANDEGGGNLALYAVAGTGLLAGVFALGKGLSKKG